MIVLKLGGSVITEKADPETVDETALRAAAAALAAVDHLVLVHGGGSFGHPAADRYGLSRTDGSHDVAAITEVHDAMRRLNRQVIDALQTAAVPALPVHPLSLASREADGGLTLPTEVVVAMLEEGFVPTLHGDVVTHRSKGATILSGDELVVALAAGLDADRVGLCAGVPGVLDDDGAVIDRIESVDAVEAHLGESDATDVTGGMAAKVRALLALDAPAAVFGLDDLPAFLDGESPGTLIGARK
jgi:isopentenyl phosphate kinase